MSFIEAEHVSFTYDDGTPESVPALRDMTIKIEEGEYWADGKCGLVEFLELYDLEEENDNFDSNTIGGWATEQYGGIPPVGEILRFKNVEVKIVKATKQKVLKVLSKLSQETENGEEDAE